MSSSIYTLAGDNRYFTPVIYCTAFILFVYVSLRAFLIPFTWDEDYTFYQFVVKGNIFHQTYELMSANNHLLNTWLMWGVYKLFGCNIFLLRLPNVLAFAFYVFYSIKITKECCSGFFRLAAFSLLCFNPFVLDFFSIARGYGLSITFLIGSLYYFLLFFKTWNQKNLFFSFFILSFGVLANLTLIYVVVSMIVIAAILMWNQKAPLRISKNKWIGITSLLILAHCVYVLYQLHENGSLFYGGTTGIWYDTINSLVFLSLYEMPYSMFFHWLIKITAGTIIIIAVIIAFSNILKKEYDKLTPPNTVILFIFVICVLLQVIFNKIFGIRFLVGRTALFYLPLVSMLIILTLAGILKKQGQLFYASLFIFALSLFHLIRCLNLDYVLLWK